MTACLMTACWRRTGSSYGVALALPFHAVALLLSYLGDALGDLAALIAKDP